MNRLFIQCSFQFEIQDPYSYRKPYMCLYCGISEIKINLSLFAVLVPLLPKAVKFMVYITIIFNDVLNLKIKNIWVF